MVLMKKLLLYLKVLSNYYYTYNLIRYHKYARWSLFKLIATKSCYKVLKIIPLRLIIKKKLSRLLPRISWSVLDSGRRNEYRGSLEKLVSVHAVIT